MAYQILSGEIQPNALYEVVGTQSVIYNFIGYSTGQRFKGIRAIKTFTYSGSGTQEVNEVFQLLGGTIEYVETSIDNTSFADKTLLKGMSVEFALNDAEKVKSEVTKIKGFSIEVIDYPFYSFEIIETRL
jgi:hypothetical protein